MTYFSLRKPDPEPEPEETDETPDEPTTWLGAIQAGVLGPGRWIAAHTSLGAAWTVHIVAIWACGYYGGWIAAGVIAGWLAAVLLFVPREFLERIAVCFEQWDEGSPEALDEAVAGVESGPAEHIPADPHAVLVHWLDDLTQGRSGIHLDELHQALTRHPQLADLKRPEMRAWLDRHQVAVDRTLRVGKKAGRSGVSRATVEALLKALPPVAESGGTEPPVHASDLHDSPVESSLERSGEHAV